MPALNEIIDVNVSAASSKSVIHCGEGAFEKYAPALAQKSLFIITDSNVHSIYGELIKDAFKGAPVHVFKAGEQSKNYCTLLAILRHMLSYGATRSTTVVALGGGVVGDVAGLAASLYMRGTPLVQIPTTLLSQVDSSVGGKTAVDLDGVKNAVGAFYQPREVIVDPVFLKTLPKKQIRCGLGEIIKYGGIDEKIYKSLMRNAGGLFDERFIKSVITPCIEHKARVVEEDERDISGARKALNLGHTTGHAFELFYKRKSHGEFVLIGLYYELYIAQKLNICPADYADEMRGLIEKVIKIPVLKDVERAALNAVHDKKNTASGEVSVMAPTGVGKCREIKLSVDEYVKLICQCAASC